MRIPMNLSFSWLDAYTIEENTLDTVIANTHMPVAFAPIESAERWGQRVRGVARLTTVTQVCVKKPTHKP